jgi:RHS repeat-associated protein
VASENGRGSHHLAKGFTNHEQTDPSGLIYMQARFYLPMYGRFASPDPARDQHFEQTQSWNIYSYVMNNPTMSTDPTGMLTEDEKKRAAQGASASVGTQAATDAAARAHYHEMTAPLKGAPKGDPVASAARTVAKETARAESTPAGAYIAEQMRPMAQEAARAAGTAGKTNAAVDSAMGVAGKAGPALLVVGAAISVKTVADAPQGQKFRAAAGESGAWAGAISFGAAFAKGGAVIGSFFGPGPGTAIGAGVGAVVGGVVGSIAGHKAAENMYDAVNQ